jgi:regulator of sirC expression with transglutaminase-like and TPR domain
MPAETNEQGWILHSHGQGRKFGPLTEDELRNYFRAGMVKSVDRLTPPGETARHAAADVASALGEPVPVGPPPPPEVVEAPRPPPPPPMPARPTVPSAAGPTTPPVAGVDPDAEARVARAMAAMNIDLSLMSSTPPKKKGTGLVGPLLLGAMLLFMLVVALNMLRKMKPPQDPSSNMPGAAMISDSTDDTQASAPPAALEEGVRQPERGAPPEPAAPTLDDTYQRKAESLRDAGDWAGLVSHATQWSQASPGRNEPQRFLAVAYMNLADYGNAEQALKKYLSRSPNDDDARKMLAQLYQQSRRFDEAAAIYKEMVDQSPNDAIAWNNYGASLAGSGQQAQAVVALENAVRIDPTMKAAWTNLGNLYQQMGDSTKAKAAFANGR